MGPPERRPHSFHSGRALLLGSGGSHWLPRLLHLDQAPLKPTNAHTSFLVGISINLSMTSRPEVTTPNMVYCKQVGPWTLLLD